MKMKIKTGQTVKVLSGKDKGKQGKVLQVFPKLEKVVVDGVNKSYRHLRARGRKQKGERVEYFGPIHVSNVKVAEGVETTKPEGKKPGPSKKKEGKN